MSSSVPRERIVLYAALGETRAALFADPGRPIPPATMAAHHIPDEDVGGAPVWADAASHVLRPVGGVVAFAAHRAAFEERFCTRQLAGGVPLI